jgi:hypothetical protein
MKHLFRLLDSATGETVWQGRAYDACHAEEKAFWDESPGSMERFTLQKWGRVKLSREITGKGWVTLYRDACLAPV